MAAAVAVVLDSTSVSELFVSPLSPLSDMLLLWLRWLCGLACELLGRTRSEESEVAANYDGDDRRQVAEVRPRTVREKGGGSRGAEGAGKGKEEAEEEAAAASAGRCSSASLSCRHHHHRTWNQEEKREKAHLMRT